MQPSQRLSLPQMLSLLEKHINPSRLSTNYFCRNNLKSISSSELFMLLATGLNIACLVYFGILINKTNLNRKHNKIENLCSSNNGTITADNDDICETYFKQDVKEDDYIPWLTMVEKCCNNSSNTCHDDLETFADDYCITAASITLMLYAMIFMAGFAGVTLYYFYIKLNKRTEYTSIPDQSITTSLSITQVAEFNNILANIRSLQIPSSSQQDHPVNVKLAALMATLPTVVNSTVSTETIKEMHKALKALIETMQASSQRSINVQYNVQDRLTDTDPETGSMNVYTRLLSS